MKQLLVLSTTAFLSAAIIYTFINHKNLQSGTALNIKAKKYEKEWGGSQGAQAASKSKNSGG